MANIKSQKKRIETNEKSRQRNVAVRSRVKTYVKEAEQALASNDPAKLDAAVKTALSEIDRACSKGVYHAKTAARKKSNIQRRAAATKS